MDLKGKLKADSAGFLIGTPVDTGVLTAIKSDTRSILALMRGHARAQSRQAQRPVASPASPAAAAAMARSAVATPAPRGSARVRDPATGRYTAGGASGSAAVTRPMAETARAAAAMARTVEAQRRDAKADAAARASGQQRGSNGRFGAGGRGSGRMGGALGAIAAGAGAATQGTEQIDPLLAAIGEARGAFNMVRGTVSPIGRAGAALFGRGEAGADQPADLLRRMWRELRAMRKDDVKATRETVRAIKESGGGGAGSEGGGLWSMLASLLPALAAAIPGLTALTGIVGKIAAMVGLGGGALAAGAKGAGAFAKGALKKLPIIGPLLALGLGALEDQDIAGDSKLTEAEKRERRGANAGEVAGGLGGAAAGAAIGTLILPGVGTVAGAVIGGLAGGAGGGRIGKAIGSRWGGVRGDIASASSTAGVDPGLVAQIAAYESGFDPNARPIGRDGKPLSSAHGLGQMLDGTWVDMVRKHGGKYGVADAARMSKQQALGLRGNQSLQAQMLAELTAENVERGRKIGGADDAANVYALHNLGAGDGSKFLQALKSNPGAAIGDVLSAKVIANNPDLYKGGAVSVSEAYARMGQRMAKSNTFAQDARSMVGLPAVMAATPRMPPLAAVSAVPPAVAAGAPPLVEAIQASRASGQGQAVAAAAAPVGQDVRDRSIAHIVTGGIGGVIAHR